MDLSSNLPSTSLRQSLSIVVITLNEASNLCRCLTALTNVAKEIIVVAGGSSDETAFVASHFDVRLVSTNKSRGLQLATGGTLTSGEWLLFLHGDTVLEEDWETAVAQFINAVASKKVAGVFRYQNDINSSAGKLLEQYVAWRTKLGLPYGDQGLLISREIYEKLGGFRKIEIMEDVDFVCKIGFKNIRIIPACATTSGSRYSRNGILFRGMRNLLCLGLYFLGVSPRVIARIYQ